MPGYTYTGPLAIPPEVTIVIFKDNNVIILVTEQSRSQFIQRKVWSSERGGDRASMDAAPSHAAIEAAPSRAAMEAAARSSAEAAPRSRVEEAALASPAASDEIPAAQLTRTPSQVRTLARFDSYPLDSHGYSKFDSWGEKFKVYAAFEVGIWLPGLFALCYCYQPSVRFVRTRVGGAVVQSIGAWLRRYTPSQYEKIAALSERAYGSPKGRTTAEWLLINKVLSPVALPSKLFLANCARLRPEPKLNQRLVWSADAQLPTRCAGIVSRQSQQAAAARSVQATTSR